jgi:hypothetical protein
LKLLETQMGNASFTAFLSDIPSEQMCYDVNPSLWEVFHNVYKSVNGVRPCTDWTESEVVQWLDTYGDE